MSVCDVCTVLVKKYLGCSLFKNIINKQIFEFLFKTKDLVQNMI